jgi:hypothetical protein
MKEWKRVAVERLPKPQTIRWVVDFSLKQIQNVHNQYYDEHRLKLSQSKKAS